MVPWNSKKENKTHQNNWIKQFQKAILKMENWTCLGWHSVNCSQKQTLRHHLQARRKRASVLGSIRGRKIKLDWLWKRSMKIPELIGLPSPNMMEKAVRAIQPTICNCLVVLGKAETKCRGSTPNVSEITKMQYLQWTFRLRRATTSLTSRIQNLRRTQLLWSVSRRRAGKQEER